MEDLTDVPTLCIGGWMISQRNVSKTVGDAPEVFAVSIYGQTFEPGTGAYPTGLHRFMEVIDILNDDKHVIVADPRDKTGVKRIKLRLCRPRKGKDRDWMIARLRAYREHLRMRQI